MAIGLVNTWLIIQQNRQQARAMNPLGKPIEKTRMNLMFHRFWPMGAMVLILIGTWIPYIIGKASSSPLTEPPAVLSAWWLELPKASPVPTSSSVIVGSTQFSNKYVDRYNVFLFVRVDDNTVDANSDRLIDKSTPFKIPVGGSVTITVPFSAPALARLNTPRMVSHYLVILPKSVDPFDVSTLGGVVTHGGYVLGAARNGPTGS